MVRLAKASTQTGAMYMSLSIKVACPKHSRYNPASAGEAGIRGGCPHCYALLQIYHELKGLYEHIRVTQGINLSFLGK